MNIPNILTIMRFLLIPFFAYFLHMQKYLISFFIFLLGGLTDILDGYIARKFDLITSWGKLADPLADKLMQITALTFLTIQGKIPLFVLIIVIIKETLMGIGGVLLYKQKNYVVSANWYGKLASLIFYFAIIMILFKAPYSNIFILIALIMTLFAFFMYLKNYIEIRKLY